MKRKLSISLDEEVIRKIDEERRRELKPRSTLINEVLRKHLGLRKEEVPIG